MDAPQMMSELILSFPVFFFSGTTMRHEEIIRWTDSWRLAVTDIIRWADDQIVPDRGSSDRRRLKHCQSEDERVN